MTADDLYNDRDKFYLNVPGYVKAVLLVSFVAGAGILGYGFHSYEGRTVWGAYLFNLFFFFCLGLGGMAMSAIQDVIGAVWGRPIKRIWEVFGYFVPVAAVMFLIFIIAIAANLGDARSVYSWIKNPDIVHSFYGKNVWLSENFFYARVVFILTVVSLLTLWQLKLNVGRDKKFLSGNRADAIAYAQGVKERTNFWSGGVLVCYGICLTFLGFDVTMSLSPLWFSTLFGGWQFAIMMQTLFATSLLMMFMLKGTKIGSVFSRQQFHDVGKLMHGFTIFFAYLTYAHVLTYWYGNVPEETEYFIHRLHDPWLSILIFIPIVAFVIPLYSLVFKSAKWTAIAAVPLALMILVGQWFTNLIVVMPEVTTLGEYYVPLLEVGGFLFFVALFFGTFILVGQKVPMVSIGDPLLPEGLKMGHH